MKGSLRWFLAALIILWWVNSPNIESSGRSAQSAIKTMTALQTSSTSIGQPIVYPKTDKPEVTITRTEIPPGAETGWHQHPVPGYGYVLSGTLTVETKEGKQYRVQQGQGLAEMVGVAHNGKNTGSEAVTLITVWTGERGAPRTISVAGRQ